LRIWAGGPSHPLFSRIFSCLGGPPFMVGYSYHITPARPSQTSPTSATNSPLILASPQSMSNYVSSPIGGRKGRPMKLFKLTKRSQFGWMPAQGGHDMKCVARRSQFPALSIGRFALRHCKRALSDSGTLQGEANPRAVTHETKSRQAGRHDGTI
jgi:hypothetical protein